MSTSDADTSSDSNMESPFSQAMESPYSSPSQQVPQLANNLTELTCAENYRRNNGGPELQIVEQPQNHFRFRYKSEMIGTHGCLLGKSSSSSKAKTHPTIELRNYVGKALIRCRLARHDNPEEHPHKLLEDDQDREVSSVIPQHGSYRVGFSGMGIIHTAKKDVPALLYRKYALERPNSKFNENKLRVQSENEAKNINLNIVRLKFSAHDLLSDDEICPPVFSEPIHNMKSAATNDLKICRISRCYGRPKGGDDVFIFVEKVNKKNIKIRFFELGENGERVWTETGTFLQNDVHHQYGIVFRTPQYRNPQITSDVKVHIELVRPSDGRVSEPRDFTYKAESIYRQTKKRKANSSYSSLDSLSGSSVKSYNELPATVEFINQNGTFKNDDDDEIMKEIPNYIAIPQTTQVAPTSESIMEEALWSDRVTILGPQHTTFSQLLSKPNVPEPPVLQLNSSEMDRILARSLEMPTEERNQFGKTDLSEYFKLFDAGDAAEPGAMDFLKSTAMLLADSGVAKKVSDIKQDASTSEPTKNIKKDKEYSASYKYEDGMEVKKLIQELCEIIRNKTGYKKQFVRSKLERLFEMRLCNGDTFLHMTLSSNQPSLEYIVKLIDSMRMTKLLNLKNNQMRTILHLAVINDLPRLVTFLVQKGCNPMEEDDEGNNAVHYAVKCQACLEPLLDAIKKYAVTCDINAYNNERQTALHLAAIYGCARSVKLLVQHGASLHARDADARTPLHLAAYDDQGNVVQAILKDTPFDEVDVVDGKGYTALQIICDAELRENTLEIAKLLIEKKADPTKHEDYNQPAWKLARDKPALLQLLQPYIHSQVLADDDIKSEPEDEYDSAEEGDPIQDSESLAELPQYIGEVSAVLEREHAWRELARRLKSEGLLSWYAATESPARTLLNHIKEVGDNVSSRSLALILDDMGQTEAASIIRKYIYD